MSDVPPPPTWFVMLAESRREELKGWPRTAAILWTMNRYGKWWLLEGFENKKEALAQPEIQLSPSTADQYVEVYDKFRHVPKEQLERVRPRLLYQACKEVGEDREKALEAVSDAQVMSWSSFRSKWRPEKSHLLDK